MTGFGNQSFDAREKGDERGTGLNWWDAYTDANKVAKVVGTDAYKRNVTELGVQADGRTKPEMICRADLRPPPPPDRSRQYHRRHNIRRGSWPGIAGGSPRRNRNRVRPRFRW